MKASSPSTWPAWLVPLIVSQAIGVGTTYAAIRSDLREALVRVELHEKRLDRLEDRKP
ncbi:MAG TPA: hypothetical protein VF522_13090 [Ramlibacter sp.]|uniref:hypothetical protein n=1 Tax=Ramlibacter sp. TaxID=1917967 RepID=UPI002ED38F9B